MNPLQERLIGQRRPDRNSEDAIKFVRPGQHVISDIESPASNLAHRLRTLQVISAQPQRFLGPPALGDIDAIEVNILLTPRLYREQADHLTIRTADFGFHRMVVSARVGYHRPHDFRQQIVFSPTEPHQPIARGRI